MTMDTSRIQYEELADTNADVLLEIAHGELEDYIRETRSIMDNAQMVHDRLRAIRMEKIRRECIRNQGTGGDE